MPTTAEQTKGHRERLKKRFLTGGTAALADYELLELLLMQAIPRRDVKPISKDLIKKFGSFSKVLNAPEKELKETPYVGDSVVTTLKLSLGVAEVYRKEKLKTTPKMDKLNLLDYLYTKFSSLEHEEFHVIYLDNKNKMIDDHRLFRGTINNAAVYPREIVKQALQKNAASMVLVHNHPSGDPTPSLDDERITLEIQAAAQILEIQVHDHIVIGDKQHYSFADHGKL